MRLIITVNEKSKDKTFKTVNQLINAIGDLLNEKGFEVVYLAHKLETDETLIDDTDDDDNDDVI